MRLPWHTCCHHLTRRGYRACRSGRCSRRSRCVRRRCDTNHHQSQRRHHGHTAHHFAGARCCCHRGICCQRIHPSPRPTRSHPRGCGTDYHGGHSHSGSCSRHMTNTLGGLRMGLSSSHRRLRSVSRSRYIPRHLLPQSCRLSGCRCMSQRLRYAGTWACRLRTQCLPLGCSRRGMVRGSLHRCGHVICT